MKYGSYRSNKTYKTYFLAYFAFPCLFHLTLPYIAYFTFPCLTLPSPRLPYTILRNPAGMGVEKFMSFCVMGCTKRRVRACRARRCMGDVLAP